MYFIHSDQSKAEKGLSCKVKSAALKDVPPNELQRRKFQKETKRPNIIVYMLLFFL